MGIFTKTTFAAAAITIAGCSGDSGNTGDNSQTSITSVPEIVIAQPQDDQLSNQSDEVDTVISGPVSDSTDTQSDTQTDAVNNLINPENTVSDGNEESAQQAGSDATDTNNLSSNIEATQNSSFYCESVSASVSYERYCPTGTCFPIEGRYVPFPASGFGWDGSQLCDMSASTSVQAIDQLIPYVADRPDIDGRFIFAEWDKSSEAGTLNYEVTENRIDNLLFTNTPDYLDGTGNSRWRMMHDGTNLYLLVAARTDAVNPNSVFEPTDAIYEVPLIVDSELLWQDDSIEIYIDGNNSKDTVFDGIDDFQVTMRWTESGFDLAISEASPQSLGIFYRADINFGTPVYEVAINLESAGIEIGKPFGFDVHINDDDNSDERDAKWGWFEKSGLDRAWHDPSVFGTLILTDCEDRSACGSYQVVSE